MAKCVLRKLGNADHNTYHTEIILNTLHSKTYMIQHEEHS